MYITGLGNMSSEQRERTVPNGSWVPFSLRKENTMIQDELDCVFLTSLLNLYDLRSCVIESKELVPYYVCVVLMGSP